MKANKPKLKKTNDNPENEEKKTIKDESELLDMNNYHLRRRFSIDSKDAEKYLQEKTKKSYNDITAYTKKELATMIEIQHNLDYFGEDNDSTEFELLDCVLIKEDKLSDYYNFADEFNFDPISIVEQFIDKLLFLITRNFNKA